MGRTSGSLAERFKKNWAEMAVGVTAAYLALQKVVGWAREAAEIDEALETLNSLTAQYNTNAHGMVGLIQDASHGLIGVKAAAEVANDALMKGFTPDQVRQMASWAATLSHVKAGTISATEAFRTLEETMATGRERGVIKLIGPTIDLASAMGKNAEMMSKAEKQQAIFALVQERMAKVQATVNDRFDSAADRMERFNNSLSQAKYFFGELLLVVAGPFMAVFNVALTLIYGVAGAISTVVTTITMATDAIGLTDKQAEAWGKRADRMYELAARQGKQALDNVQMAIDALRAMDQAHAAPLPQGQSDGENRKRLEKLNELVRKYAEERELINASELDRELVKLNHWFEEQRKKLQELAATDREYSELVALYTEKHQRLRFERSAKLAEMEVKEHEKRIKQTEALEKAHSDAILSEQERAVNRRLKLAEVAAETGLATEQERIRSRYLAEKELLEIQGLRILGEIKEEATIEEILAVLERFAQVQKQITELKELEAAETDRANLRTDADRQIRLVNEGVGRQKLHLDEVNAKVTAYERLWTYAHGTITGYMASLYESGLRMFQGLEEAITQFAITGKMRFRDFANSVIADLIRIAVRAQIVAPLAQGLLGLFGGFGGGSSAASVNLGGGGYGFSGLPATYFPARAGGGEVYPGITYLVGERGKELFTPKVPGVVTPVERAGGKDVKVQIINESGSPMQVTKSTARIDPQELIVTLWLDAVEHNKYGLAYALGRA
jgi:lambda family phage tail tape measure protein